MLVNSIIECKTVIGEDDSVRFLVQADTNQGLINLEFNDSHIRHLIGFGVGHLYESKRDIYAECLHQCMQDLAFLQLGLQDEDE